MPLNPYLIFYQFFVTTDITLTSSMLFKPIPENLDFFILNDHLYQALQKSKQTRHLINLRAEEIVKSILKQCIQTQIYQKYLESIQSHNQKQEECESLQKQIEKIKEKQQKRKKNLIKELKSQTQSKLIQARNELESKDEEIQTLNSEITKLEETINQIQQENENLASQIVKTNQEIQGLNKQLLKEREKAKQLQELAIKSKQQIEKIIFTHQQQMEKAYTKQKNYVSAIKTLQEKLKQKDDRIQTLTKAVNEKQSFDAENFLKLDNDLKKSVRLVEKLKKELKQGEQRYNFIKKELSKFKDKYKKFQAEYNQETLASNQSLKEKTQLLQKQQKSIEYLETKVKSLKQKNQVLTQSKKNIQSKFEKIEKIASNSLLTLKQQNLTLRSYVKESFYLMKEYLETSVTKIVNHLSTELNEHFQICLFEAKKAREEKNLARQEVKIKTDLIEYLDKMLNSESKSVNDLRYQLKQKIKEADKLKKQLKNQYHQSERKLEDFHTKFISILKNQ